MQRISLALTAALLAALLIAAGCDTATAPPPPAAGPGPASAPEAAIPRYEPPAPGTIVVVRHRGGGLETSRVLGSEGHVLTMLREGQRITEIPFCFGCDSPPDAGAGTGQYPTLWPLEVGKSATFRQRRGGDGTVRLHEVAVTGTETLETELGPVETLVIEEAVTGDGDWRATRTQWFSPQLGWAVRSEWHSPDGGPGGWELAAIALPQ